MAQAEDTELRDLVIEALERNGSLAKIRALLRANIFLAFEDECENIKQNVNLDSILKIPEGLLALSVVHEFLEFCCLKNTLFVYMSESRQGNEYNYDGRNILSEKCNITKCDNVKEPLLLTLIKKTLNTQHNKQYDKNHEKSNDKNYREEQNCTYILHEDSQSNTSNSQSDNSSDEKNKLHLRLQLDNSDTDTSSSDSARDKTSSEYIPGDHILDNDKNIGNNAKFLSQKPQSNDFVNPARNQNNFMVHDRQDKDTTSILKELKLTTGSSSESTSYLELKPFNSLDEKMLNTAGLPIVEPDLKDPSMSYLQNDVPSVASATTISSASPLSLSKEDNRKRQTSDQKSQDSEKSDIETAEFSYGDDFSTSPVLKIKDTTDKQGKSPDSIQDDHEKNSNKSLESPHQISQSSQSSVSLSDVADLISEKSSISYRNNKSIISGNNNSKEKSGSKQSKIVSDDSGDFTESPVPSLSNLSLDIHSD